MQKGKTGKYLKYAIGEIILVVIGILIALQVNDWNENRKAFHRKNALLKSLQSEFKLNLLQLDSVLYYDNLAVKNSLKLLHLDASKIKNWHRDSLRILIQNSSWTWTFDPLNGALRSGVSSGDINLIHNDSLKILIYNWQDVVADAKENENRAHNTRWNEKVLEKHIRNVDYRSADRAELGKSKFQSDYKSLIQDPLFEDYISNRYARIREAVLELNQVRAQNVTILKLINLEINVDKQ
ncbi:DUF6090 family protein [Xanthomarina sp. GH4-25]|uniref:DUF6090 family protein n=1 Tax=Xanthomarina sp. GH4-25 TaxID=3349335 RepID=UPI003877AABB